MNEIIIKDLGNNNEEIEYIVHISDIHIRLNSRHIEYIEVFNKLYEKIRLHDRNKGIIVITGDIFDTKQSLTSESIKISIEFFINLSNILPLFIICGNHDSLLSNPDRMDNISGVLTNRKIKNLHYLQLSGIYKYENILFGVSSLIDNINVHSSLLDDYINKNNLKDILKIGLYHGPVGELEMNELYTLKSQKTVKDFEDYDYTLLGDYHKYKYLNEEKTIGYSSSLISQSFSECDDDHGYLYWDLKNKDSYYVRIENDYRYKKCVLENDILKIDDKNYNINDKTEIELLKDVLPKKGKVEINIGDGQSYESINLIKRINKDISWSVRNLPSKNGVKNITLKKIQERVIILDYRELINNFFKKDIKEEHLDWVYDKLKDKIKDSTKEGYTWELLELKFSNLCLYGEDNTIDFTEYNKNEILLLIGNNNTGKSSLIDIICYILYKEFLRHEENENTNQDYILNINKNSGYGQIIFKIGHKLYLITKKLERKKTISHITNLYEMEEINEVNRKENTYLYKDKEYKLVSLLENKKSENEAVLNNLIGNYKDILLSNILLQDRFDSFKSMKQSDRKIYLYDILELNSLSNDIEHSNYKLEYAKHDEKNKIHKKYIDLIDKEIINKELLNNIENLNNNKKLIKQYDDKKNELYEKNQELNIELGLNKNYEKTLKDKCSIEINIVNKQKKIDILLNEIKEYDKEEISVLNDKIKELMKNKKNEYRIDLTYEEYKKQINELEIEYDKINITEYEEIKNHYKKIEEEYIINYEKKNKNINIIDYELNKINKSSIGKETKDILLKMREELLINNNMFSIDNLENDIIELENKSNLKEEYEKYIQQKIKLNKEEGLLKEFEKYEYNPECHICCKNEKVKDLKKLSEEIKELKIILNDELEERMIEYKKNEKDLIYKKEELKKLNKINSNIKYLELLENKKLEEEIWSNNNFKKKKEMMENEIKELEKNKKIKDNLEQKMKELKKKEEIIKDNELIKENNKLLEIEINDKEKLLEKIVETEKIKYEIMKHMEEILQIDCIEQKILNTKEIEQNILDNNREYKLYEKEIGNKTLENYHLEKRILEIEKEIVEFDNNLIEYYKTLDLKIKYEYLVKLTHNDGLKLYVLNKYLEPIENGINNIINNFMDKRVKLYIDDRKNKGYIRFEINIIDDKKIKNVDILGGRESLMVELALRLVLSQISLKPKPNFLIIDERFSVLDINNINNIDLIFNFLNTYYEHTIVMSHIEIIKDYVKNRIYVENDNKFSKLKKQ
jgi:DNA repair exonuclease SbcCD ATPase subunit/DNA repair exonuclease SbcCD nuclease subunit